MILGLTKVILVNLLARVFHDIATANSSRMDSKYWSTIIIQVNLLMILLVPEEETSYISEYTKGLSQLLVVRLFATILVAIMIMLHTIANVANSSTTDCERGLKETSGWFSDFYLWTFINWLNWVQSFRIYSDWNEE